MSASQDCMYMVKQLHDTIEKNMNQALGRYDLTMMQMGALVLLHREKQGSCTMKEFEQVLHLAQSTTAGVVKRLEQKGYVESSTDNRDRRIKNIHITPAGLELCHSAVKTVDSTLQHMFDGLEKEELHMLVYLLKKACKAIQ